MEVCFFFCCPHGFRRKGCRLRFHIPCFFGRFFCHIFYGIIFTEDFFVYSFFLCHFHRFLFFGNFFQWFYHLKAFRGLGRHLCALLQLIHLQSSAKYHIEVPFGFFHRHFVFFDKVVNRFPFFHAVILLFLTENRFFDFGMLCGFHFMKLNVEIFFIHHTATLCFLFFQSCRFHFFFLTDAVSLVFDFLIAHLSSDFLMVCQCTHSTKERTSCCQNNGNHQHRQ